MTFYKKLFHKGFHNMSSCDSLRWQDKVGSENMFSNIFKMINVFNQGVISMELLQQAASH